MTNWQQHGACIPDPDLMFPNSGDKLGIETAKQICAGCSVELICLDEAMRTEGPASKENRFGIRGGLTGSQRRYQYDKSKAVAR
ncbi:WhiB family transcriptional regulator [Streptomyces sp. ISL-98]|uniref:WhiB family transcriptional regulator n=1 Tax=Streptomyces sp. ISL-98 TaxID=2819192 RepID=UPI001BEC7278|nr:WhiB family transcriptional regulator [Streptomyces sp. ISL-98]MBT2508858.1 WhiB family transcriptional regulator [Streptomyces sp. ISL-98]